MWAQQSCSILGGLQSHSGVSCGREKGHSNRTGGRGGLREKPQDFRVGGELWKTQKPQPKRGNRNSASQDSNLLAKHHSVWLSQLAAFHKRAWKKICCCVCWDTLFSLCLIKAGVQHYTMSPSTHWEISSWLAPSCHIHPWIGISWEAWGFALTGCRKRNTRQNQSSGSWLYGTSLHGTWHQRVACAPCENKQRGRDGQKDRLKKRTWEGLTLLHPLWTLPCQNKSLERLIVTHLVPTTSTCLSRLCI